MDLQPARQFDYLQRTLSIFLNKSSDMSEQFESLIDELIKENKQIQKSPKNSPDSSSSSDSKSDQLTNATSPQPLQQKKRSAPLAANSKPPPPKRLKPSTTNDDDDESTSNNSKRKKTQSEDKPLKIENDDNTDDDEDTNNDSKSKASESQNNPSSSSRHIDEFAVEMGLVCSKCMVLTEEKDNRLVECHECHAKYHQKCHKPPVSTADISDPRRLWYCVKCRRIIAKRQQTPSSIKESKANSNSSSSTNKSKVNESSLVPVKKGISNSITDVTSGIFTFKAKSSDSITSDNTSISHSTSNSSQSNGTATPTTTKNVNGWASLVTGFKDQKSSSEVTTSSATSILAELTALTSSSNTTNTSEIKRSPPSPKLTTVNPFSKISSNGSALGLLKSAGSSLSALKTSKPTSPTALKPQLSASSLKGSQKVLPTTKPIQRISSPTPLGRPTSLLKSPPTTANSAYQRLNSSGSHSSSSHSPSSSSTSNAKVPTGLDYEKRVKQMRKMAAQKSLTKKC